MVMVLLPALECFKESIKHVETGRPLAGLQKHPLAAGPACWEEGPRRGRRPETLGEEASSRREACDWFPGCLPHPCHPVHFTPMRGGPRRCLLFGLLWAGERARFCCRIRETSSRYCREQKSGLSTQSSSFLEELWPR